MTLERWQRQFKPQALPEPAQTREKREQLLDLYKCGSILRRVLSNYYQGARWTCEDCGDWDDISHAERNYRLNQFAKFNTRIDRVVSIATRTGQGVIRELRQDRSVYKSAVMSELKSSFDRLFGEYEFESSFTNQLVRTFILVGELFPMLAGAINVQFEQYGEHVRLRIYGHYQRGE